MIDLVKVDVRSVSEVGLACLTLADDLESPGDSIRAELYLLRTSNRFARRSMLGTVTITRNDDATYAVDLTLVVDKHGDAVTLSFEHDGMNPPIIHDYSATTSKAAFFASGAKASRKREAA